MPGKHWHRFWALTNKLLIKVDAPSHAHALASIRVLIVVAQTILAGLMPTYNREKHQQRMIASSGSAFVAANFNLPPVDQPPCRQPRTAVASYFHVHHEMCLKSL